ncbi:hypothetical protein MUK42_11134, partial [Musa troglodytarum]
MATPLPRSPSTARRSTGRLRFSFLPFSSRLALLALSSSLLLCFHMVFVFFSLFLSIRNRMSDSNNNNIATVGGGRHRVSDPTPWHLFPHVKQQLRSIAAFRCHFLSCPRRRIPPPTMPKPRRPCPSFFRWIHRDLQPWRRSRISPAMVAEAGRHGAMRVVNLEGKRLFVDLYYACVQSRAMFTIWVLLQLLRRCPGVVPDVESCLIAWTGPPLIGPSTVRTTVAPMAVISRHRRRSSATAPPEIILTSPSRTGPSGAEFQNIKLGSQTMKWRKRARTAYWKGNPDVQSPVREAFYKIYAEGYAWSVSLKYIVACGSLALIIEPRYEDFFSRGLVPKENYWPISPTDLCPSIKFAVEWGNRNPSKAEAIGKKGQAFMQELNLDQVYDYMYHLIEYSKLQRISSQLLHRRLKRSAWSPFFALQTSSKESCSRDHMLRLLRPLCHALFFHPASLRDCESSRQLDMY